MLIDIDRFKTVNDTLGHHVGDDLLKSVASRLRDAVRASDIVARLGGDEFVVVLPDIENALVAASVAGKVQRALGGSHAVGCHVLFATPSMGISIFPSDGRDSDTLLKNADVAMYHAKSAGRNNFQFFAARMNEAASERLMLENTLRTAVSGITPEHSEFTLHFQPQMDAASGQIIGLEALARWQHETLGNVPPGRFIPVAEDTGLIQPLGDWVFWESCRHSRLLKELGISGIPIAVNISAQQLRHENLPLTVHGAMACYDLNACDIELEITESTAMQNPEITIAILNQLSGMGIALAIDDFGTGYSSLAYLKHLPIQRLKLDQSFVKDIESDRSDAAICSATIALGHNLGLKLVAEGVETKAQQDFLTKLGCDYMQGYLYSKPLPFEQLVKFIQSYQTPITE
jgi:diguanylate cyclase (GGDEF)-like protein